MEKVKVLNLEIHNTTRADLLRDLNQGVLYTPNADHLVLLQKDREFYEAYKKCEWVVCDSRIVAMCARLLGFSIKEVIQGSSFFSEYYKYHREDENVRIFMLGAKPGVAQLAMEKINAKIGRKIIVGAHSPSFSFENDEDENLRIIDIIKQSSATVLLVGVGAPKQEKWIARNRARLPGVRLYMALGATIDFEAGKLRRAPKLCQSIGLEWLFRLITEPRRLWRRYLVDDLALFPLIILQKIKKYKAPFC